MVPYLQFLSARAAVITLYWPKYGHSSIFSSCLVMAWKANHIDQTLFTSIYPSLLPPLSHFPSTPIPTSPTYSQHPTKDPKAPWPLVSEHVMSCWGQYLDFSLPPILHLSSLTVASGFYGFSWPEEKRLFNWINTIHNSSPYHLQKIKQC